VLAVYAASIDPHDPLAGLVVGERPEPVVPAGWTVVQVRAASVNHHDVWSLRGVGLPPERLPMILGCDAAGVDADGREVIVHSVVATPDFAGDETMDPARSLLSERHQGTFAERVAVPRRNLVPKPPELSMAEAACLPTAWLTAYRMLATRSSLRAGDTVLVQGAGGGVATAAIMLGRAMGLRVWATSRDEARRERALAIGAHEVFRSGARLPERVDAVVESVGAATWDHSLKSLRPGGEIIVTGATSGANPPADLQRVFFRQLSVIGSTMGTRDELRRLVSLCTATGLRPLVERTLPMAQAREAIAEVAAGEVFGKLVLTLAP
jgi:NADPH:quinone reductase-like Zn-dependent oxidoreductase